MSSIGLGHPRFLHTDLNLLAQILTLAIIFVSLYYKRKGKLKHHGATMGIAVIVHIVTFVSVMAPIFFEYFSFYSTELGNSLAQVTWLHAVPGAIALILAIFIVGVWAVNSSNVAGCYKRKRIMDVTLLLWLISLLFGIVTYVMTYL
ncbi:MAG: hypothetical protein ACOWW1_02445 [archaeon]|nr:hypothetical protein [Candidatus Bathyarchaeum sp.]